MIDLNTLRAKIIELAIKGKLVEQRPEEGTAEELYAQIREEKQKLVAEKKIKKSKILVSILENDIPFEIPENWKWVRLEEICTKIVDGSHNPPRGEDVKTSYIMISAKNIQKDSLYDLEQVRFLSRENFTSENLRTNVSKGDILLTIVGTLGRSCICQNTLNITCQRSVCVIKTCVLNKFVKFVLDSPYIQNVLQYKSSGTAQKGFYLNQVAELLVPLPPLAEQKRIAEKLDAMLSVLDTAETLLERKKALNVKLKDKILQLAIQGKLVEQRPEEGTAEELYAQIKKKNKN